MPALTEVKPWGRSLAEYEAFFGLTPGDLEGAILDCGAGPSSFNAEAAALGASVISCDPIYEFSAEDIEARIRETTPEIIEHVAADRDHYVWTAFNSPEQMVRARLATMQRFLADYPAGLREQRYRPHSLPSLPFTDGEFDLALCSHLLFTYSDVLSLDFHLASLRELARVVAEIRVFPLLNSDGNPSAHLEPVIEQLSDEGFSLERTRVPYEFQRGGNQMLKLSATVRSRSAS